MAKGFVKSFACKARKPGKSEAYFSYVEPFPGEAQRSRRTFYEAVKFKSFNINIPSIYGGLRFANPPYSTFLQEHTFASSSFSSITS